MNRTGTPQPDDLVTIGKGDGSRIVEQRRFVARDRQSFGAVWTAHAGPDTPAPAIDFDSRMIAAVFAGARPTPGFVVDITGARREDSALVIVAEERAPDTGQVAAQVMVSPFHIVSLPRDDGEVRFDTPDGPQQTTIVFKPPKRSKQADAAHAESIGRTTRILPTSGGLAARDWQTDESSSTGLTPQVAASMAYLAGPFSGALLLATERTNGFVRFHAWQAVIGLGALGTAAVVFLILAFALLLVSSTAFWAMLWLAAATGVTWIVVWALCLIQAYKGRIWKIPLAGDYAERRATSLPASAAR